MPPDNIPRKLLVLDLDETLVHARESVLEHEPDFYVGPYAVYRRPYLDKFIASVAEKFDVCVWTSAGEEYAQQIAEEIFPVGVLKFLLSGQHCVIARDFETNEYSPIKDLKKLKPKGFDLGSIVAVDDTPSKYRRNFGNLVTVREFVGDISDSELPLLLRYLNILAEVENIRTIEKRNWRNQVLALDVNN